MKTPLIPVNHEAHMSVFMDTKKALSYDKHSATPWGWHDRDEPGEVHGGFRTAWEAICDATEPYFDKDSEG